MLSISIAGKFSMIFRNKKVFIFLKIYLLIHTLISETKLTRQIQNKYYKINFKNK